MSENQNNNSTETKVEVTTELLQQNPDVFEQVKWFITKQLAFNMWDQRGYFGADASVLPDVILSVASGDSNPWFTSTLSDVEKFAKTATVLVDADPTGPNTGDNLSIDAALNASLFTTRDKRDRAFDAICLPNVDRSFLGKIYLRTTFTNDRWIVNIDSKKLQAVFKTNLPQLTDEQFPQLLQTVVSMTRLLVAALRFMFENNHVQIRVRDVTPPASEKTA